VLLVLLTESALFFLIAAAVLAERPVALAATGAAILAGLAATRFVTPLRTALGRAFERHHATALVGGAAGALALPLALSASP
jgi:hypothetical protein